MKTFKHLLFVSVILLACGCERNESQSLDDYVFVQPYSATVTVGGFIGIKEKFFLVGDTVLGYKDDEGDICIRIAPHSELNEGAPGPWSYQEFLEIPDGYLKELE